MWCRRIPTERAVVKTQVEVEESLKCRLKEGKTFCLKLLLCSNICTRTNIEGNKTIIKYCILDSGVLIAPQAAQVATGQISGKVLSL